MTASRKSWPTRLELWAEADGTGLTFDSSTEFRLLEVRAKVDALIKEKSSLEKVIELVDEWINDESGYDEETYPQIQAALNQSRLSL